MLKSALCRVSGHKINRRRVWHDKIDFRTSCDRCDASLIRDDHKGWREFDNDRDLLVEREPHPRHA